MTDPFLDGEQYIIAKKTKHNRHAQLFLRTETSPGVFLTTSCRGHISKNRATGKWVFGDREYNTIEGAAIAAFMYHEEHPRPRDIL